MEQERGHIKVKIEAGIGEIEFYHPAHNAMPGYLLAELAEAIKKTAEKEEVNILILRSAGDRTFCAGASFDELMAIDNFNDGKAFFLGFANVINACRTCGKLIIGRVQGKAVGGGVGLASAVDYCISTKFASVKLSELAVGIGPFVVGPAVERKIGLSAFSQMAINAKEWQTANWAKEKGLFTEVFDSIEQLDSYLESFTKTLASMNPEAMKALKKAFWEGTESWESLLEERAEISGQLVLSSYTKKAIAAFKKA